MQPRTIEEIEKAFREMGIAAGSWGRTAVPQAEEQQSAQTEPQIFIRIEATTTPLEGKADADLA